MAVNKEDILNTIAEMTVMEVVDLVEAMEEKFGVSAAAMAPTVVAAGADAVVAEQTEFNVVLKDFGSNKVSVIKAVRAITGLGLKEAKEAVEGAPSTMKEGIAKAEADDIKKQLEEAGATVEIV